jgi:hypothetical protein
VRFPRSTASEPRHCWVRSRASHVLLLLTVLSLTACTLSTGQPAASPRATTPSPPSATIPAPSPSPSPLTQPTPRASPAEQQVTVPLAQVNNSGESGTATLIAQGDQTQVVIALQGAPAEVAQPAHIHKGTCEDLAQDPTFPLTGVKDGKSRTMVAIDLASLLHNGYAINVHQSARNLQTQVACGTISSSPTGSPRPRSSPMPHGSPAP